jgi:hypothetical protein
VISRSADTELAALTGDGANESRGPEQFAHVHLCHPRQTGASGFDVQAGAGGAAEEVHDGERASARQRRTNAATSPATRTTASLLSPRRSRPSARTIGELAIATAAAQVIAAAGAEATYPTRTGANIGGTRSVTWAPA